MADQYGLIPLPLGAPFEAAATEQANQPALPFGGYMAGWTAATGVAFSAAITEGADVLAAQVEATVAVSLARTEGADALAAQVGPLVAASSALSEGADVVAAQVGPRIGVSSALAEDADALAAQVGPQVAVSLAQIEGADGLAASVDIATNTVDFSAALQEGADLLDAQISTAQGGGYDDDRPKRRRFIQKVGDKLIVTTDASAALSSVQDKQETPTPEPVAAAAPAVQEISLAEIRTVAAQYQQQAKVLQMFRQRDWAEMVALYESLKRQQDEDDIEMLLLSL